MEDTPIKILSVREKLQGFAIREDGRMAISTSYGLANSHIYFYESVLDGEADTTVTVNEAEVPVWYVEDVYKRQIVSRALPDVRDGLKPVHRRILYTMYENSLWPERAYRKCADTVGTDVYKRQGVLDAHLFK